jgi:peptidoglycan/LPS O-acetylase OafA/YrhL
MLTKVSNSSPAPSVHSSQNPLLGYKPGLDGLRGLAVLAVFLYHSGFLTSSPIVLAPSGYLGVDLFFVLSGYLITSLLLAEWRRTSRISLKRFWLQRARRLIPALVLVLLSTSIFTFIVLGEGESGQSFVGDMWSTLTYVANWRYLLSNNLYFEQVDTPSILKHMWSLGIEEQFYVIWPLVIMVLLKLVRLRTSTVGGIRRAMRRWLLVVSCFGAIASATWMAFESKNDVSVARIYYGTDTRAFALLGGVALAGALANRSDRALTGRLAQTFGVVSLIGWLTMVVLVGRHEDMPAWMFQGGFVATTVFCMIIIGVAAGSGWFASVLGAKPLVQLGRLSYSIYLWHWPVIVVLNSDRTGMGGIRLLLIRAATSVALSVATFVIIERRMRTPNWWSRGRALIALGVTLTMFVVATFVLLNHDNNVGGEFKSSTPPPTLTGPPIRMLAIGDSVALTLFEARPQRLGWDIYVQKTDGLLACALGPLSEPGASLVTEGKSSPTPSQYQTACINKLTVWQKSMLEFKPDVVVALFGPRDRFDIQIDGRAISQGSSEFAKLFTQHLVELLKMVESSHAKLVLLTTPCLGQLTSYYKDLPEIADNGRRAVVNDLYQSFAEAHPNEVVLVDFAKLVCPTGDFTGSLAGTTYTNDGIHFTPKGAAVVWSLLDPILARAIGLYDSKSKK